MTEKIKQWLAKTPSRGTEKETLFMHQLLPTDRQEDDLCVLFTF